MIVATDPQHETQETQPQGGRARVYCLACNFTDICFLSFPR